MRTQSAPFGPGHPKEKGGVRATQGSTYRAVFFIFEVTHNRFSVSCESTTILLTPCIFPGNLSYPRAYQIFRWANVERDLLVCSSCEAAVCVTFRPALSARSVSKLVVCYREMLAASHSGNCPFRSDADFGYERIGGNSKGRGRSLYL